MAEQRLFVTNRKFKGVTFNEERMTPISCYFENCGFVNCQIVDPVNSTFKDTSMDGTVISDSVGVEIFGGFYGTGAFVGSCVGLKWFPKKADNMDMRACPMINISFHMSCETRMELSPISLGYMIAYLLNLDSIDAVKSHPFFDLGKDKALAGAEVYVQGVLDARELDQEPNP